MYIYKYKIKIIVLHSIEYATNAHFIVLSQVVVRVDLIIE